jgi:amino acid transporter
VRQAAFIGVGSMVGAGIFALLGAAGAVAGAAVWLSFLLAGVVAILQGYSFAKLGARYPSAGANVLILMAAIAAAGVVLVTFVFTTLIHEPASIVALLVILVLSTALDYWWKRSRTGGAKHVQVVH